MSFKKAQEDPAQHLPFRREVTSPLGPILCVCFTNHALDQFLLGLVDAGIENIVRVGGNSKTERLAPYNLRNLHKVGLGPRGYELRKEIIPEAEKRINRVNDDLQRPGQRSVSLHCSRVRSVRCSFSYVPWYQVERLIDIDCPYFIECLEAGIGYNEYTYDRQSAWLEWCRLYINGFDEWNHPPQTTNRTIDELLEADDFWDLTETEHRRFYEHWERLARDTTRRSIERLLNRYESLVGENTQLENASNLTCLLKASVVGMTTTYVAKNQNLLAGLMPKIVILEEAAEVLEAHVLTSLSSNTQQLIMIGDHQQLRPRVDNYILQAHSGSGFDLDVSMFERLITDNKIPYVTLQSQRRMRPQFSQ